MTDEHTRQRTEYPAPPTPEQRIAKLEKRIEELTEICNERYALNVRRLATLERWHIGENAGPHEDSYLQYVHEEEKTDE